MSSRKKTTTKKSRPRKSGEALRKEVLGTLQSDLARMDAADRGDSAPSKSGGKTKKEKDTKPKPKKSVRKLSLLDHAAAILVKSSDPLNAKQIVDKVMASTDWKTDGKTPHATLYSAMIREIAEKGRESRFKKVERGLFASTA